MNCFFSYVNIDRIVFEIFNCVIFKRGTIQIKFDTHLLGKFYQNRVKNKGVITYFCCVINSTNFKPS